MDEKSVVAFAAEGWNQGWVDIDDLMVKVSGEVLAEDLITTRGLGAWVKVASSIYRFYLPEDDDIIH